MMKEVLHRRFSKIQNDEIVVPDLVIVDGGPGQYSVARKTLDELGFFTLQIIAIAKGEKRNQGDETFYTNSKKIKLNHNQSLLFFLQRLRDEAHRFAISSHKIKRKKSFIRSALDDIDGIGSGRKKLLLNHFGSVKLLETATVDEIKKVKGISYEIANKIYNYFNTQRIVSRA